MISSNRSDIRDGLIETVVCIVSLILFLFVGGMGVGVFPEPTALSQLIDSDPRYGWVAFIAYFVVSFVLFALFIENVKIAIGYYNGMIRWRARTSRGL